MSAPSPRRRRSRSARRYDEQPPNVQFIDRAPSTGNQPESGGAGIGSVHALTRALRRRWPIVAVCVIALPIAAFAFAVSQPKEYTASASLLFRDPGFDRKLFGSDIFATDDPVRAANTNVKLVGLEVVAARTSKALGGHPTTTKIQKSVSVSPEGQSSLASVSAKARSPRAAAKLANTFAEQFIAFRRDSDRSKVLQAQQLIQSQIDAMTPAEKLSPQARTLETQANQLGVLASLQTGNAELVQPADIPPHPSWPRPKLFAVLGLLLGGVLGVGLAFLAEQLDKRLKDSDDVEEIFGLPILASIPRSRHLASPHMQGSLRPGTEAEAFRMLRTNLVYFNVDRPVRSVVVTSPSPGDGKTTVAWNLAAAAALAGSRVLFIEADMRRPSLARMLEFPTADGLSLVLVGATSVDNAIFPAPSPMLGEPGASSLHVLHAGPVPPNPAKLIESARMTELIHEMEKRYDLVILDTPPLMHVADSVPLMTEASGVVVVCRLRQTRRDAAARMREQLENLNVNPLGVAINDAAQAEPYYATYSYRGRDASDSPPEYAAPSDTMPRGDLRPRPERPAPSREGGSGMPAPRRARGTATAGDQPD